MRSFLIAWLVAFGLITVVASGISWYVARNTPPPAAASRQTVGAEPDLINPGPFLEADAVELIGRRLPTDPSGDQARQKLQNASTVTYHSAQHWRVCFEDACWVAHGPGRYAEPENDAARRHEAHTTPQR